jgi:hypothetical protein
VIDRASGEICAMIPQNPGALVVQQSHALALSAPHFLVKRSFWSFLGRTTHVFAPDGRLACFMKAKLLSWRGETTLFADEQQTQPIMTMKARQVIGFSINHDVFDTATGARLGSIRNRGLGIFRDAWDLLDGYDQPFGEMAEGSGAIWRRIFPILKNGKWDISVQGQVVATIREKWTLFSKEYVLDLSMNGGRVDPRFAMACTLLALNRESARESSN